VARRGKEERKDDGAAEQELTQGPRGFDVKEMRTKKRRDLSKHVPVWMKRIYHAVVVFVVVVVVVVVGIVLARRTPFLQFPQAARVDLILGERVCGCCCCARRLCVGVLCMTSACQGGARENNLGVVC